MPESNGVNARMTRAEADIVELFDRARGIDRLEVQVKGQAVEIHELRADVKAGFASIEAKLGKRDEADRDRRQFTWGQAIAVGLALLSIVVAVIVAYTAGPT